MPSRISVFSSPLLLGFETIERSLEAASRRSGEGYPPYNIERLGETGFRITLAVAGFGPDELSVAIENDQLVVRGKLQDRDADRVFLHRGIGTRAFQRAFVLAEGVEVTGASLDRGLLNIDLSRPQPAARVRQVPIRQGSEGDGARAIDVTPDRGGER